MKAESSLSKILAVLFLCDIIFTIMINCFFDFKESYYADRIISYSFRSLSLALFTAVSVRCGRFNKLTIACLLFIIAYVVQMAGSSVGTNLFFSVFHIAGLVMMAITFPAGKYRVSAILNIVIPTIVSTVTGLTSVYGIHMDYLSLFSSMSAAWFYWCFGRFLLSYSSEYDCQLSADPNLTSSDSHF